MDVLKEGGSIVHPPLLDRTNYGYQKGCMRAFIKSMDELAWKALMTDWSHPMKEDESGNEFPKSELEWKTEEDTQSPDN